MDDLSYTNSLENVTPDMLAGFFDGWPNPPSQDTHLRLLHSSYEFVLALKDGRAVGFITAISDGVLCAYIPLLEVLPAYKGRGIGSELVRRMQAALQHLYMVDLICDEDVAPFYERVGGLHRTGGFIARNYEAQSGAL